MPRSFRLYATLVFLVLVLVQHQAQAGVELYWEYSVETLPQKFKTLGEAEAAMRAMPDQAQYWSSGVTTYELHSGLTASYVSYMSTSRYQLQYYVPPQGAIQGPWKYYGHGGPFASESQAVDSKVTAYLSGYLPTICTGTATPTGDWHNTGSFSPDLVSYWLPAGPQARSYYIDITCPNGSHSGINDIVNRGADLSCGDPSHYRVTWAQYNVNMQDPPGNSYTLVSKGCWNQTAVKIYANMVPSVCTGCEGGNLTVGDPSSVATGTQNETETDIPGGGGGLTFKRSYNSRQDLRSASLLGAGWTHSFSSRLIIVGSNVYANIRADGSWETFSYVTTGTFVSSQGTGRQLRLAGSEWTLTNPSGDREVYDAYGRLLRLVSASGQTTTLTYDNQRRVSLVTGPFGHTLTFTYDAATGKLASVADAANQVVSYAYTGDNLTGVTYPDGSTRSYLYENANLPNHLTGIAINGVRYSTFAYDDHGRAISTEHTGGVQHYSLSFNADGTTTATDAAGGVTTYSFVYPTSSPRVVSSVADALGHDARTYDSYWRLKSYTDERGSKTTYTYDSYHRTGKTEASGTVNARTTSYQYLATDSNLPMLIQSPSVAGGTNTKQVIISYDANRNPITIAQSGFTPSGTAVSRSVTLGYNASGQVTSIDGPRTDVADVTGLSYYNCATGGACGQLQSITNALGQTTTYDSYDADGRLLQMTNPNGVHTSYAYDVRGRMTTITQSTASTSRVTSYAYDAAGNVTSASLPSGLTLTYTYNAAQLLTQVTDSLGNRIDYGYDLKGNCTQSYTYDPSGTLARQVDLAFDLRNRVSQINSGGSVTKQVWDAIGNLTAVTDPNTVAANGSAATANSYDSLNRLFKTVDLLNGNTQYGYDINDRVTTAQAPNGATTQYAYDDLGNLLSETSPDRGTLTYTFDAAGNVRTLTDARGITVSYSYDALNRLTSVVYPDPAENVSYVYDNGANCSFGIGRLCSVQDAAGSEQYAYDAFGNVVTDTRTELNVSYTTSYAYDAANRVLSITYPNGRQVNYTRDARGMIQSVSMSLQGANTTLVSASSYRPDGLLLTRSFGNGLTDTRSYDLQGQLVNDFVGSLDTRVYGYDANGNLTSLQSLPQVGAYQYDALNRLSREDLTTQATASTTWSYDANGNRLTQNAGAYSYTAASNRLTQGPDGSLALDASGNTTSDQSGVRNYSYYQAGTLSQVMVSGGLAGSYSYDAQNRRTRKSTPTGMTVYHYDLQGNLLAETDDGGHLLRDYVWADGTPIAKVEAGETLAYLHTDPLNTPRVATNPQGQVVWRWDGTAFGETAPNEDPGNTGTATHINLRFPGQYYDGESGLYYNWNRYYDPKTGRYITSDPIGLDAGPNTFGYVLGNPLYYSDPLGLDVFPLVIQIETGTVGQPGKNDATTIVLGGHNGLISTYPGSTLPGDPKHCATIEEGIYDYMEEFNARKRYRLLRILGEPRVVGGVNPNPASTASQGHANGVLNHKTYHSPNNGLCGCTGVDKDRWDDYMKNFKDNERGKLIIYRVPRFGTNQADSSLVPTGP